MQVTFLHPSTSDSFPAEVERACTGELAVRGLIDAGFVPRPRRGSYDLVVSRSRAPIGSRMTFGDAGVAENDAINVFRRGAGAE